MPYRKASAAVIVAPCFVNGATVLREMGRKGAFCVAADHSPDAVGFSSRYTKETVVLPPPDGNPRAFVDFLLSRPDLSGGIVITTDDTYVRQVYRHYDEISPHYHLAVSPGDSTAVALDKDRAYDEARKVGLPTPKTTMLADPSDLADAASYIGFPAILRARFSLAFVQEFHCKSFLVDNLDQAREKLSLALASGHEMMLQEIIPGPEENLATCRSYATDDGRLSGLFTAVKLTQIPPVYGIGQVQESRWNPEVLEMTVTLLKAIGYRGAVASVEWKLDDRDHTWKLIEINCRAVQSQPISRFCGKDHLDMLYRDKLSLPELPETPALYNRRVTYIKNGIRLYRGWPDCRKSLREYLHIYRPPICPYMLKLYDLRPFLVDIAPLLRRAFTRSRRSPDT